MNLENNSRIKVLKKVIHEFPELISESQLYFFPYYDRTYDSHLK